MGVLIKMQRLLFFLGIFYASLGFCASRFEACKGSLASLTGVIRLDVPKIRLVESSLNPSINTDEVIEWVESLFQAVAAMMPPEIREDDELSVSLKAEANSDKFSWTKRHLVISEKTIISKNIAILLHEIGHYYFGRYLIRTLPFFQKLRERELLKALTDPETFKELMQTIYLRRYLEQLEPYNELFADLVAGVSCRDGNCIGNQEYRNINHGGVTEEAWLRLLDQPELAYLRLRNMNEVYSVEDIIQNSQLEVSKLLGITISNVDPHLHLHRARSLIFQYYRDHLADNMSQAKFFRIVLETIVTEVRGWAGTGLFLKSDVKYAGRANQALYERFLKRVKEKSKDP